MSKQGYNAKDGILYKDTKAMPGSDLHKLLTEQFATNDQKKFQELRKKVELCYNECNQRYLKSIGETK